MKYYLDPDFRRDAPKDGLYCVRCQKPISEKSVFVSCDVNWDTMEVEEDPRGKYVIGKDCLRKIKKTRISIHTKTKM